MVKIKRIYDPVSPDDGRRILVDRLWPRGIKKEDADIDEWLKDIAPSGELRKWFAHDPLKWEGFKKKVQKRAQGKAGVHRTACCHGKTREYHPLVFGKG